MAIEIREVKFDSAEYNEAVALRYRILRKPLGLKFTPEDRLKDSQDTHLAAFTAGKLVGSVTLTRLSPSEVKMRQVAVASETQGAGIGRLLVEASEKWSKQHGFKTMILNARVTAVPFYERLSYIAEPEIFNEVGVPHKKMHKAL